MSATALPQQQRQTLDNILAECRALGALRLRRLAAHVSGCLCAQQQPGIWITYTVARSEWAVSYHIHMDQVPERSSLGGGRGGRGAQGRHANLCRFFQSDGLSLEQAQRVAMIFCREQKRATRRRTLMRAATPSQEVEVQLHTHGTAQHSTPQHTARTQRRQARSHPHPQPYIPTFARTAASTPAHSRTLTTGKTDSTHNAR